MMSHALGFDQIFKAADDTGNLCLVTLLVRGVRAVGVHLGRDGVLRIRHPGTQPERARLGNGDHPLLDHFLTDDIAFRVGGGNVRHLLDRRNHCTVPLGLQVGGVGDEVKAVRDGLGLVLDPVPRRFGRPEFRFICISRLVQVHVAEPLLHAERLQVGNQVAGLVGRGLRVEAAAGDHLSLWIERAVRVDRICVPSLDCLVAPRRHARRNNDVELFCKLRRHCAKEEDCALDPRSLVAVDPTSH
mmetsp:Transcript_13882/g.25285  ORF Transcript_13882/g.25285 Transcript_13882/m.25285 type:complete len:244 (+) Transcript_13882:508-1239(+)